MEFARDVARTSLLTASRCCPLRPTASIASRSEIDSAGRVKALSMSLRAIFGTCPRKWMNRWKSRMR